MYAGAVPFAIFFYFLFAPPANLNEIQVFFWLAAFSVLTRTAQSVYSIPHTSLTAELSNDYQERTLLSSLRSVLQSVGTLMVFLIGLQIFFGATPEYPNGQLNPEAYPKFAAAFAIIIFIGVVLTAYGTHSHIPYLPQVSPEGDRFNLRVVLRESAMAFGFRSFKAIVLTAVLFWHDYGDGFCPVDLSRNALFSVQSRVDRSKFPSINFRFVHRRGISDTTGTLF